MDNSDRDKLKPVMARLYLIMRLIRIVIKKNTFCVLKKFEFS